MKKWIDFILTKSKKVLENMKTWSKRTWMLAGGGFLVFMILLIILLPSSMQIATASVNQGEFIIGLVLRGEIDALKSTSVSVPRLRRRMNMQIVDMVDEGTIVKQGDFLVQMDNSDATQKVEEAKDNVANAQAQLSSEQATIESNMAQLISQLESEKYSYQQTELSLKMMRFEAEAKKQEAELNLRKAEVSLKQAKEKITSQRIIDKATLMRAELNIKQEESELRDAKAALEKLRFTAPIDGLVVYKEIWSGGTMKKVQVGDTPHHGMAIIGIPDLSMMQAKLTVNEVDINKIQKGLNAIITVDALEGKTYYGRISRVATLARRERNTNVKVFDVEVTIDSSDGELRPGMTCDCRLIIDRIPEALTIPLQSVFDKEDTTVVYVMGAAGPRMRKVSVGEKSADFIVITEGLKPGEEVCLRDPTIPLDEIGTESETTILKPKKE